MFCTRFFVARRPASLVSDKNFVRNRKIPLYKGSLWDWGFSGFLLRQAAKPSPDKRPFLSPHSAIICIQRTNDVEPPAVFMTHHRVPLGDEGDACSEGLKKGKCFLWDDQNIGAIILSSQVFYSLLCCPDRFLLPSVKETHALDWKMSIFLHQLGNILPQFICKDMVHGVVLDALLAIVHKMTRRQFWWYAQRVLLS